ncbi:SDR family oxidoreductase [bacterium]|nr:SDR family oxidoreductase [bacterium]
MAISFAEEITVLADRAIILTGANGGLGSALATYLLECGSRNLALVCHHETGQAETILKKFDLDPARHCFTAELTDEESVGRMRASIEKNFTGVYALVNVAGGSTNALSWKMTRQEFQAVLDQNLLSAFLCSREFIPAMRAAASGRIVNCSSVTAFSGAVGTAHYSAAKAGLVGLTKTLALELAPKNITVNAFALGYLEFGLIHHLSTELQDQVKSRVPARRFGTGPEVGGALRFLLSDEGAFTTGQVIHLNGGLYG